MTDDKLGEAIRWWDRMNDLEGQPVDWRPAIPVAFAAARAYSDGETVWWCEVHVASAKTTDLCWGASTQYARGSVPARCRLVSRRLVVEIEED